MSIGGESLDSVDNELPKASDVLVFGSENADIPGFFLHLFVGRGCPYRRFGELSPGGTGFLPLFLEILPELEPFLRLFVYRIFVEIAVGNRYEEGGHDVILDPVVHLLLQASRVSGDALDDIDEQVHGVGRLRVLTAHSGNRASRILRGFLTLIAKHVHFDFLLKVFAPRIW